jgi:hypothetical protein
MCEAHCTKSAQFIDNSFRLISVSYGVMVSQYYIIVFGTNVSQLIAALSDLAFHPFFSMDDKLLPAISGYPVPPFFANIGLQ